MKTILTILLILLANLAFAQENTFPVNGVNTQSNIFYAFTNAHIVIDETTEFDNATLLIKNGIIEQVGPNMAIPTNAVIIDCKGKWIYPSFIDAYVPNLNLTAQKSNEVGGGREQYESTTKGAYYWNQSIKPEINAANHVVYDDKTAEEYRNLGFGTVNTFYNDGIIRGTSAIVTLGKEKEYKSIIQSQGALQLSFNKGSSRQEYPSSLMGSIALLRQALYDAKWYKNSTEKKETNLSLVALNNSMGLPMIMETSNKLNVLRASKIAKEFNLPFIIKTNGDEYQNIKDIKQSGFSFIVPINFPATYDVEDPSDANYVTLADLKHWELAPSNLSILHNQNIVFAITSNGLTDKKDFWPNIRKAINLGLPKNAVLKALLTTPANQLKIADKVGSLKIGRLANFLISNGDVFNKNTIILQNWIQGQSHTLKQESKFDLRGNYDLTINQNLKLNIAGEKENIKAQVIQDTLKYKTTIKADRGNLTITYDVKNVGIVRLIGAYNPQSKSMNGTAYLPDGINMPWNASFTKEFIDTSKTKVDEIKKYETGKIIFPFTAYGFTEQPAQQSMHIKNATVWTNEVEGILKETDVILADGKIKSVGKNLVTPSGAIVIDGTGKHVTPGIIDEHSHIAISNGVNEGGQSVTAEVSIADVVNSEDINIYRQLSGGVTTSQLLHGSANCIGGQSAIIKLRWGQLPEKMKIAGADGFIKCALGENVKQSNWGEGYRSRFPQTRMGVEQTFIDAFTRAREYEKKINTPNFRRDLECDVLLEILNKKRFITCHSYVQSEINMLMHVADSFGFKVNTFTHILEGYKVADKMKVHGANASTFSDWWAYKMEVADAIPYNGALLHKMGVNTSFNSDDAEMARRLFQEAGKAVKYGNVSEEDALKFVTLNPAKMLHLDNNIGSLKVGKDADVVVWTGNPLSVYSRAQQTIIDGILYFDLEKDQLLKKEIAIEKSRLIQKAIVLKNNGEPVIKPNPKQLQLYDCETLENDYIKFENHNN